MSKMIRLCTGCYGRVSILSLSHYLVEHAHADTHLQFWLDGCENPVSVDGVPTPFNRQCAVAINSWQPHASPKYRAGEQSTFLLLYLRADWLEDVCSHVDKAMRFRRASFDVTPDIRRSVALLCRQMLESQNNLDEALAPLVKTLVIRSLFKVHSGQQSLRNSDAEDIIDPRIDRAIQVMSQNLDVRMSLQEIAAISSLSRPHFFALFRQSLNVSPNVYWNTLRVETAIRRLASTDIPMGDLAYELGFSEPANFSRFFKQHTGVCPSLYRSVATP